MKTNKLIIFIAILLSCMNLQAQDGDKKSSLSFGWGTGYFKEQDLAISPMIHDAISPVNAFVEYRHSGKLEHQLYTRFGLYKADFAEPFSYYYDNPDELEFSWPHSNINIDINYSLGAVVVDRNGLKLTLGGRSRNRLHPSDNVMAPSVLFGYYISFGLDAWAQLNYSVGDKHEFSANLALPVFSMNGRSAYNWMDDWYFEDTFSHKPLNILASYIGGTKMQSWGVSQSVDFDASYYYSLSEKWSIGASYWFSLNMNQYPRNPTSIENLVSFNLKLKF